jgi:RHS repeat-associated protein
VQGSGGTSYVTADTLGTPRVMTDNGGGVKARHDYLPFGEEISAGVGGRTQQQGYSQVDNVRQQFAGSERDDETGLDFMQARYYSSPMGRFTSVDPIYISKDRLVDPQAINLYAYVRNNPLSYIDPTGEYFVGTDGKRVEYKVEDGKIIFTSNNVPKDLQRMADLVSNSGSNKALSQFTGLANNETKLHFEFAKGEGNYGLHRPHDKDGNVLEWDSQNGKFKGEPAYIKDKDGNFVYQEATISIYEENIERDLSALQNDPSIKDSKMTKEDFMVATFGHEGDHNLNTKAIGIIKKRQDGGGKFDVQKKVEDPAYKVTFKVLKEIKKIRGKN